MHLDHFLIADILKGYTNDPYCHHLFTLLDSFPNLIKCDDLLYVSDCLVIPHIHSLYKKIFHLTRYIPGHFGSEKIAVQCLLLAQHAT